jgi:hypothetical protein
MKGELGMVVQAYNPSTQKVEARGPPVPGQPGLHNKTLSQKENKAREGRGEPVPVRGRLLTHAITFCTCLTCSIVKNLKTILVTNVKRL